VVFTARPEVECKTDARATLIMGRRFLKLVVLFSLLHFLVLLALEAGLFLLAHLPTGVLHVDSFIVGLTHVHQWLRVPRTALSQLWPGEYLPRFVSLLLALINSVVWGVVLAASKMLWSKARE
jgi:hypothetical protein